jgi:GNAT superfamily N-acetyltransferase
VTPVSDSEPTPRVELLADHPRLVPVIAAWHWAEWGDAYPEGSADEWARILSARAGRGPVPFTLVAFIAGEPVGAVSLVESDMPADPKVAHLSPCVSGTYVRPEQRSEGIGSVLMEALEERAHRFGLAELFLFTGEDEAEGFYERLGWQTIHRARDRDIPVAVMKKRLTPA